MGHIKTILDKLMHLSKSKGDLLEEMVELLHISSSTAYKKLNGSTQFSTEELITLAKHYHFSLDGLFDIFTDHIPFSYPHFESQFKKGIDYIDPINKDLSILAEHPDTVINYTTTEIPIFHYILSDELAIFKFFIYEGTTWNTTSQKLRKFDPSELLTNRPLLDHMKSMVNNYYKLDCVEFWSVSAFDRTIGQIKYFLTAGLTDKAFALLLMQHIYKIIDNVQEMATTGEKKLKYQPDARRGKITIYNNEIIHTGTTIYTKSEGLDTVYMTYDHPNYLRSRDQKLIDHTDKYFEKLKSKSFRITDGSDQNFYAFFNNMRARIDKVYKEIELYE